MLIASLWLLVFIGGSVVLTYQRVPLILSTLAYLIYLCAYQALGAGPDWLKLLYWVLFLVIAVPVNVPAIRRGLVSKTLLDVFRKIMPEMSQTEADALESGTVWWDGELFSGRPNWQRLLNTPAPKVSAEEQAFFDNEVEELCG